MGADNKHIEELLPRYCEGTLSKEEMQEVREWMERSEENRHIVKQIHTLYLAADTKIVLEKIDTEKALTKVTGRIETNKTKKANLFIWVQRIAAILFIPLLIAYGFQFIKGNNQSVSMIEVKTNPGMTTSVILPDGSTAYLNSETTLTYPSQFSGDRREVAIEGEAFFMVEKDAQKKFIVSMPYQSRIEVLGTHFNIDAYQKDHFVSTTLIEGKVSFHYVKGETTKDIILSPGQKLVYDVGTSETRIVKTNGESEVSWKEGKIIFAKTPMREALRMLEKRYNVEFIVRNEDLLEDSFTGTFTHQRLERILEYFKVSSNINWSYLESGDIKKEKSEIVIY